MTHNHGPDEGKGLNCTERMVDGQLKGECIAPIPHFNIHPQWDEGPTLHAIENAVRHATFDAYTKAADVAQMWKAGDSVENVEPRVIALVKIAIADEIRKVCGGGQ